jgi:hypothetical protein
MVLWGKSTRFHARYWSTHPFGWTAARKPVLESLDDQQHGVLRWKQTDDQNLFPLPSTGTDVFRDTFWHGCKVKSLCDRAPLLKKDPPKAVLSESLRKSRDQKLGSALRWYQQASWGISQGQGVNAYPKISQVKAWESLPRSTLWLIVEWKPFRISHEFGGDTAEQVLSLMGARGKIWNPSKSKEARCWWFNGVQHVLARIYAVYIYNIYIYIRIYVSVLL